VTWFDQSDAIEFCPPRCAFGGSCACLFALLQEGRIRRQNLLDPSFLLVICQRKGQEGFADEFCPLRRGQRKNTTDRALTATQTHVLFWRERPSLAGKADATTGASSAAKPRAAGTCTCCCICLSHQSTTPHLSSAALNNSTCSH